MKNYSFLFSSDSLKTEIKNLSKDITRVSACLQKDITAPKISVKLLYKPEQKNAWRAAAEHFHFIPQIKQKEQNVCGAHVFRAPVTVLFDGITWLTLVPNVHSVTADYAKHMFMDMCFAENDSEPPFIEFGFLKHKVEGHYYYTPTGEEISLKSGYTFEFYVLEFENISKEDALHKTQKFILETLGEKYLKSTLPLTADFKTYAKYGNEFAKRFYFEDENGGGIAGSTFVKADGSVGGREYQDDIWYHDWFNNVRTARELYYFGNELKNSQWLNMARKTVKLILSAPQNSKHGLYPIIYAPHNGGWVSSSFHGGGPGYYCVSACCWTAYQLMRYESECETHPNIFKFLKNLANGLQSLALPDGTFPEWVKNGEMSESEEKMHAFHNMSEKGVENRLSGTTQSATAAFFLAEYALKYGDKECADLSARCMDTLINKYFNIQKFEDFELYYSCSAKPTDFYDKCSKMFGQNTLAMQWCAGACLALYKLGKGEKYLTAGRYCVDLLSLYQQVWNPPFLSIYAFGGFGVMNTDAEWNDARQAQFAETFADFYDVTGEEIYFTRAIMAMRAAFTLVAIPENKYVSPKTAGDENYLNTYLGASPENHGHSGTDSLDGQSGYHWGTGSALVTAASFLKRYGDIVRNR